ncbi:hypothetical protein F8388_001135 [Cannabis sativa]|uniref:RING-type E3 ubiquitin transferase n=1 Tax=Cannabis sativa TaxID=3483 RepID=A0A7J6GAH1_CANSA|nr:hypothetical protein F8388_001539 [Cannabis sativa]KAF4361246.1 hypothetical protein F8388_001135 [Cannabis sativa]KAF4379953.1 hypothetical protein G4B88_029945 [Cannabis sativa]
MTSPQVIGDPHYHISPYRYSYTTQPNTIEEELHARFFTINLNAKFILAPHSSSMEVEDEESLFDDDAGNSTAFLENIGWISYETLMKSDVTEALLNIEDMLAEDVSVGLEAAKLPCTHAYHEECVVEWLQVSKFCPNCRVEIV